MKRQLSSITLALFIILTLSLSSLATETVGPTEPTASTNSTDSELEELAWYETFPLNSFYQVTTLTVDTSYSWGEGSLYDFTVQNRIPEDLNFNYTLEMNLEGDLYNNYLTSYLYYPSLGEPEFTFNFETPHWTVDFNTLKLKFPLLSTTFAPQEMEGLRVNYTDYSQDVNIFYGTKLYKSKTYTKTILDENKIKYDLFLEAGLDGDIVNNSEIVYLQGERLRRYTDYKVNYLDGNITLLTPLRYDTILEVKYLFKPQGVEVEDRIGGAYYTYKVDRSSIGAFLFHQKEKDTYWKQDPDDFTKEIEVTEEICTDYIGSVFNIVQNQYTLKGEMAWTDPREETVDYGGQVHLNYTPIPELKLDYQLTTATEGYRGVGPVPISVGEKHQVQGDYQLSEDWSFDLELAQIKKNQGFMESLLRTGETTVHYQVHPQHQLFVSLEGSSIEEWGETTNSYDYLSGWQYQVTDDLSVSFENSLKELQRHQLNIEMDTYQLRFNTEYKQYAEMIPFYGEIWWRESNTDLTYRPVNGVTITGDLDYLQNVEYKFADSKRRLALMVIATPNRQVSTRSNYVYFYNPDTQNRTLYYDTTSTLLLPFNLQWDVKLDHIQIDSETVANTNRKWNTGLQLPLFDRWTVSYEVGKKDEEVFLKKDNKVNTGKDDLNTGYGISYLVNDQLTCGLTYTNSKTSMVVGSSLNQEIEDRTELNLDYLQEDHSFQYTLAYTKDTKEQQLQQKINWDRSWNGFTYSYQGQINYSTLERQLLTHQESFLLEWARETSPYRPSLELNYNDVDHQQDWTKRKITSKLVYLLSKEKNIFAEVGHADYFNQLTPEKNYWVHFIRTGVEYMF